MRVVVAGGGYAGLACLLELRALAPRAELHLADPGVAHLKQTQLHEALHRRLAELQVPYAELARRYRFEHHAMTLGREGGFSPEDLRRWSDERAIELGGERLDYDYLVIATGARPRVRAATAGAGERIWDQLDLRAREARDVVRRHLLHGDAERVATVVGGGASGVQVAFELAETLRRRASTARVRLVDAGDRLLPGLPLAADEYVREQMSRAGIEFLPRSAYVAQDGTRLRLRDCATGGERDLESSLTFLFAGVAAHPFELAADRYGRVTLGHETLNGVFAAGDCVRYAARGLDALTAQAAVRKGRHVAANITRLHRERAPIAYAFQELGYVVSLGSLDSVGWVLVPQNVVRGVPAAAVRKLVEAQYDLYLDGLDTYVL